jgi:hypothetical protein
MTVHRTSNADTGLSFRRSVRIVLGLVAAVSAGVLLASLWPKENLNVTPDTGAVSESTTRQDTAPTAEATQPVSGKQSSNSSTRRSAPAQAVQAVVHAEPTPETRQLVNSLVKLQPENGILTDEFAKEWKQNLQQLVQQGHVGIPAIQEFLSQNLDYVFGDTGRQFLGYSSARGAMFDALAQIGGPEAVAAMAGVLQTTADPREIAQLAQDLDKLEPGQHHQEAVNAAQQALALAGGQKLESSDVAPLFEVLQKYGGAAVIGELQKATGQWGYYGPISLAQLPDGAGIPSLVQMAQDPKISNATRDAALLSLAQVFDQSPQARSALVEQAKANGISEFAWRIMAPVLAGDRLGFLDSAFDNRQGVPEVAGLRTTSTSDNQHFFSIPSDVSQAQADQRISLIDEMLAATTDPVGQEVLQQSKSALANRLPQVAATTTTGQ